MCEHSLYVQAGKILARHGWSPAQLGFIGAGEQSACYGTKDVAVLLSRSDAGENVADLTGHVVPGSDAATSCNDYAVLQWLTAQAADAGVRTPRVLTIGEDPRPYALIQRAHGTLASVHPHVTEKAATWFGQLGAASVLTHYDNRLDNLVVDADEITVLDWRLSLAGTGIHQELIKLFESGPMSMKNPRVAAFLHGYGLSDDECVEAIEGGKLLLVLDGLAMSYGWAEQPDRLEGIRAWLRTVRRSSSAW